MSLPSIDSEAQMSSSPDTWMLSAHCMASDFRLSLAPDIAEGIFKLLDLYEQGKDRMKDLERHYWAETARQQPSSASEEVITPVSPRREQRIIVRMSFTFNSGIVELHRMGGTRRNGTPSSKSRKGAWHDTFVLPTISVWMDYAGPEQGGEASSDKDGMLVINSVSSMRVLS
jgi:hypothetical protein